MHEANARGNFDNIYGRPSRRLTSGCRAQREYFDRSAEWPRDRTEGEKESRRPERSISDVGYALEMPVYLNNSVSSLYEKVNGYWNTLQSSYASIQVVRIF